MTRRDGAEIDKKRRRRRVFRAAAEQLLSFRSAGAVRQSGTPKGTVVRDF
jgi:hypothetical protein